jgi:chemotaxis protein MotB
VRRKKKSHGEEGNSERWLVSYADFITLLFAFFTTLYAISTVDAQKMGKMVTSMRASFDANLFSAGSENLTLSQSPGSGPSGGPSTDSLQRATMAGGDSIDDVTLKSLESVKFSRSKAAYGEKALGRLKRSVDSLLNDDILNGLVRTHVEPRGLIVSLGEIGLFDSGSDQIKPHGKILLDTLATSLVSVGNHVRIEGHTDNVPIHNSKFPSNWELSTARATGVLSYMIGKFGFRPDLLSAAGYGEYRPVASNKTEEGKARNRRVDIVILNPAAAEIEPTQMTNYE